MEKTKALKQINFFASLDQDRLQELADLMNEYTIPANHRIVTENTTNTSFYIILDGKVNVTLRGEDEKPIPIATLSAGDCFGEMSLISGVPASASIITETLCRMYILDKNDFQALLKRHPELYNYIAQELSVRLTKTNHDLRKQIVDLDTLNAHLEILVQEKTRDLSIRNREFQDILTNINQAIFTIKEDGKIKHEYSKMTEGIFETDRIADVDFYQVLFPLGNETKEKIWQAFVEKVFAKSLMATEICEKELPETEFDYEYKDEEGRIRVKNFNISVEPVFSTLEDKEEHLKGIMFIVKDVTETFILKQAIQKKEEELEENASDIIAIISMDRELFTLFLDEAKEVLLFLDDNLAIPSNLDNNDILYEMYRKIHSVKGNAGAFQLVGIEKLSHELEEIFDEARQHKLILSARTIEHIEDTMKELNKKILQADDYLAFFDSQKGVPQAIRTRTVEELTIKVPLKKIDLLSSMVQVLKNNGNIAPQREKISTEIRLLRMVPVQSIFKRYQRIVKDLAQSVGKEVQLVLHGEELMIDRVIFENMSELMIHLIRNAIDHGIESPAVRQGLNKPSYGTIDLAAAWQNGNVIIQITDDGQGIDGRRIIEKAVEKDEIDFRTAEKMTEKEGIELIFKPGFSTKSKATNVSGRGIGLDAIVSALYSLNGKLQLKTEVGIGTTIRMIIPEMTSSHV